MLRAVIRVTVIALFVLAAIVVGRMLRDNDPEAAVAEAAPKLVVRMASHDLMVGTFLDANKAPFEAWSGDASDDFVTQGIPPERDVIGAVVIAPIPAGQPVPRSKLLLPGQDGFLAAVLAPGMRASSVAVDAVSGNAGLIFPGDRVDLILTQNLDTGDGRASLAERWASETILENVRVIAVDQSLSTDLAHRSDQSRVARTITLEVSPRDAEKVALASGLGRLSLSLRSLRLGDQDGGDAAASAGRAPDRPDSRRPTWASDVSAVVRDAGSRPEPAEQPAAEAAPPAAAPSSPRMRVFRGNQAESVP
jgi:pilus assembly protein CpaB